MGTGLIDFPVTILKVLEKSKQSNNLLLEQYNIANSIVILKSI